MPNTPKYRTGDILHLPGRPNRPDDPTIIMRVVNVRHFPDHRHQDRIGYELDILNQEEIQFPFPRVNYFEAELERLGAIRTPRYYLLTVSGGVEPALAGPFATEAERDAAARSLAGGQDAERDSLFWLNVADEVPTTGVYSADFFM